jgi:hypothetical protein
LTVHGSERAVLRLAWSARPDRIENCRQQSSEQLARLPAHMRQPFVCEGATAEYRLTVTSGSQVVADALVRAGGLRQDRSLYVFHEVPLDPGEAAVDVRFDRLGSDAPAGTAADSRTMAESGSGGQRRPRSETVPPHLSFRQRLQVRPREVILVTYSQERHALVAVRQSSPPAAR